MSRTKSNEELYLGRKVRRPVSQLLGEIILVVEGGKVSPTFHVRFPNYIGTNMILCELEFIDDDWSDEDEIRFQEKRVENKSKEQKTADILSRLEVYSEDEILDAAEKCLQQESRERKKQKAIINSGEQECRMCNETKPFDDFNKQKTSKTGYRNYCKVCAKSYVKK